MHPSTGYLLHNATVLAEDAGDRGAQVGKIVLVILGIAAVCLVATVIFFAVGSFLDWLWAHPVIPWGLAGGSAGFGVAGYIFASQPLWICSAVLAAPFALAAVFYFLQLVTSS